jgi:hypothetical protein
LTSAEARLHEDLKFIEARLERARRRVDEASPYSPEWDAATEAVNDLTLRLERAMRDQTARV